MLRPRGLQYAMFAARMSQRVLVVEDDDDLREIVCEVLDSAGYEAMPAAGGDQALSLLAAARHVDLILLDLTMPGMSGFELRERLLRSPELRTIPVIVMTASRAFDPATLSPSDVLFKPIDVTRLLDSIEKVIPSAPVAASV
ncbi:MAG: response regulator receiver protein [Labilithrix sp.]|nr:response regulator receiver protein [Labilithrix sp.]